MRPEKFSCYPHVQWGYGPNGKMLCSSSAYDLQDQNAKAEDDFTEKSPSMAYSGAM